MSNKCKIKVNGEVVDAVFMGLFQSSNVVSPSPMVGGHRGGIASHPVAVVKVGEQLKEVRVSQVIFDKEPEGNKVTLYADGKEYVTFSDEPDKWIDSMEAFEKSMSNKAKTANDTINDFKKLMGTNNGVKFDKSNFKCDIAGDKESMLSHFKQLGEYK